MAHEQAVMPANDAPPVAAAPPAHVQLTTDAPKNWRPVIAIGFIILLGFFGGFGGWAAYAPLGTGAIAVGQVQVVGKQKMVQSKDGGIIAALHVRDGDVVSTGQVLLELDSTETQVEVSVLSSQLWALQARMARLEAERLNSPVPKFPAELLAESDNPEVVKLIESERRLFDKRRAAFNSQVGLLDTRVAKIQREIAAHRAEQKADRRQLVLIEEEIAAVRVLLEKGLERKPRLLALQRQQASLDGRVGNRVALIARAEQAISEIEFQTASFTENTEAEVETNLGQTREQIAEISERLRGARERLERTLVRAPTDGQVFGSRFHTVGGVIPPSEVILGIVPLDQKLNVEVHIDPKDIDVVKIGALTTVRLTSFSQRTFKPVDGELIRISADIVNDGRSPPYYVGEIVLDPERLAQQADLELIQGMPAMAIISTGDQTMLDYIIAPIARSVEFSLREN